MVWRADTHLVPFLPPSHFIRLLLARNSCVEGVPISSSMLMR